VKSDGRREPFDERKLRTGFERALQKRPVSAEQIDAAVRAVINALRTSGERELPSRRLGEFVMAELKKLDQVAYVRFASVYRRFEDVPNSARRSSGSSATAGHGDRTAACSTIRCRDAALADAIERRPASRQSTLARGTTRSGDTVFALDAELPRRAAARASAGPLPTTLLAWTARRSARSAWSSRTPELQAHGSPWLASLLVKPKRRRGIGARLARRRVGARRRGVGDCSCSRPSTRISTRAWAGARWRAPRSRAPAVDLMCIAPAQAASAA
jgi:hypothetical protein